MIVAATLLLVGLALSAFFSGCETGYYRVTRVRLVIDAVEGDRISRGLLALTNFPALFVATAMIGNNLANYLTSLGVVLLTRELISDHTDLTELVATVLFSPLVFVYGELLPKHLFYSVPNLLLRRSAPALLAFTVLFAPISALLWFFGFLLQTVLGETPLRVQPALARKELKSILREGHEAGLLSPSQRQMAENVFDIGGGRVEGFCRTESRIVSVFEDASRDQILQRAKRHRQPILAIKDRRTKAWVGYLRVVDLLLSDQPVSRSVRPLLELRRGETLIQALLRMQRGKVEVARVVDEAGKTYGLLYARDIIDRMVRNRSGSLPTPSFPKLSRPAVLPDRLPQTAATSGQDTSRVDG
jgi:putative hemolysin